MLGLRFFASSYSILINRQIGRFMAYRIGDSLHVARRSKWTSRKRLLKGKLMSNANKKVIITCAVTGSIHTPTMTPYLPITPAEIAESSVQAYEAGG
jgi:hypothetical protein